MATHPKLKIGDESTSPMSNCIHAASPLRCQGWDTLSDLVCVTRPGLQYCDPFQQPQKTSSGSISEATWCRHIGENGNNERGTAWKVCPFWTGIVLQHRGKKKKKPSTKKPSSEKMRGVDTVTCKSFNIHMARGAYHITFMYHFTILYPYPPKKKKKKRPIHTPSPLHTKHLHIKVENCNVTLQPLEIYSHIHLHLCGVKMCKSCTSSHGWSELNRQGKFSSSPKRTCNTAVLHQCNCGHHYSHYDYFLQ